MIYTKIPIICIILSLAVVTLGCGGSAKDLTDIPQGKRPVAPDVEQFENETGSGTITVVFKTGTSQAKIEKAIESVKGEVENSNPVTLSYFLKVKDRSEAVDTLKSNSNVEEVH